MYNLLISADKNAWQGTPLRIDKGRCINEYTDTEIKNKYGGLTRSQINEIRRLPCIFAYESQCSKNPLFGVIRDVKERNGEVRIEYEIIPLERFLTYNELADLSFDLDIGEWEMNRTHWAIKDVNLSKELASKGIRLPRWTRSESKAVDVTKHVFDIALSFPGEIRDYVRQVAEELERIVGPNSYFYDDNYVAQLARPSLDVLLKTIYRDRSKLLVVFLCEKYQEKKWCGIEFAAIREVIFDRQAERVMYVKMDDGEVEGVSKIDGYVDARVYNPIDLAVFIQERLSHLQ